MDNPFAKEVYARTFRKGVLERTNSVTPETSKLLESIIEHSGLIIMHKLNGPDCCTLAALAHNAGHKALYAQWVTWERALRRVPPQIYYDEPQIMLSTELRELDLQHLSSDADILFIDEPPELVISSGPVGELILEQLGVPAPVVIGTMRDIEIDQHLATWSVACIELKWKKKKGYVLSDA